MLQKLFPRRRTFQGGIQLPAHNALSITQPIISIPTPARIWVPSQQYTEPPAEIVVAAGQHIQAGQLLARKTTNRAINVHAPADGEVIDVGAVDTACAKDVPTVQIAVSQAASEISSRPIDVHQLRNTLMSMNVLIVAAERAGLTNGGLSLDDVLNEASTHKIEHIIINALPHEPSMTAGLAVFLNNLDASLLIADVVHKMLRAKHTWLAIDSADKEIVRRCRIAGAGTSVRVFPLPNKYPQANPNLLSQVIARKEVPHGKFPITIGVLVIEASALTALAQAAIQSQPAAETVVAVGGSAVERPGHYRVPIGTRYHDIVGHVGLKLPLGRIIEGGAMSGKAVHSLDAVVTKATHAILLLDKNSERIPAPAPCIHCGWCQEDCPVGLDPFALLDLYQRQQWTNAAQRHPLACIECGICSYVCPTELPLAESIKKLKKRHHVVMNTGAQRAK